MAGEGIDDIARHRRDRKSKGKPYR